MIVGLNPSGEAPHTAWPLALGETMEVSKSFSLANLPAGLMNPNSMYGPVCGRLYADMLGFKAVAGMKQPSSVYLVVTPLLPLMCRAPFLAVIIRRPGRRAYQQTTISCTSRAHSLPGKPNT